MSQINLVNGQAHHESLVASCKSAKPIYIGEAICSIAVGDTDFFSLSHARDIMNISSLSMQILLKVVNALSYTKLCLRHATKPMSARCMRTARELDAIQST